MKYFDYQSVAREAKIPEPKLRKLVELIAKEFPNDPMMADLHALRACQAIRDEHVHRRGYQTASREPRLSREGRYRNVHRKEHIERRA